MPAANRSKGGREQAIRGAEIAPRFFAERLQNGYIALEEAYAYTRRA